MIINTKSNLQQQFINDLNNISNGKTIGDYKASGFHNMVHINPKSKKIVFKRFTKDINDFNKYVRNDLDCFFTINTFKTFYRNRNNVIGLNALWADCDVEKNDITKRFFINFLPDILDESFLFPPTYIIDSGHGFHLLFLFDHQIKVKKMAMFRLGDRLEEKLLKRLKKGIVSVCGSQASGVVDFQAKDRGRLLRIPGSNNLKYKKDKRKCRVIGYTGHYYDLDFLSEELLDDYDPKKIKKTKKYHQSNKHKISRPELKIKMNQYTLHSSRLNDLYKLAELRHYNLYKMRETFLFTLSVFGIRSGLNTDDIITRVKNMNNELKYPLVQKEISNLIREIKSDSNDFTKYHYYTSTIINNFRITDVEQKSMKVLIDKKEKQNRQKKSRQIKSSNFGAKYKRDIRDSKIKQMYKKGINKTQIAKEMNIGRRTVIRSLKKQ